MGKRQSPKTVARIIRYSYGKKINLTLYIILCTKTNLKWVTDLNINAKVIILVDEHIGENLCDLGLDKEFLGHKNHEPQEK